MSAHPSGLARWLKFNAVGAIGICLQLGVLALLRSVFELNYVISTALAVEVTVIHNFLWHERFTWNDRVTRARFCRFLAFNLSNGAISLVGNVLLMRLLVGAVRLNYFIANLISIAACSLLNFVVGDQFVFTQRSETQSM